jgi:hypothetical protein
LQRFLTAPCVSFGIVPFRAPKIEKVALEQAVPGAMPGAASVPYGYL